MTIVTLENIEAVKSDQIEINEWGDRLVSSYCLSVSFDGVPHQFIWVMASSGEELIPEYGDDFDDFLIAICKGESFKKCRQFINEVQEKLSLAVHYVHTGDSSIEIELPIHIVR